MPDTQLTRTYNDLLTMTRDRVRPLLADNITDRINYVHALQMNGRKELHPGGALLRYPVFKQLGQAQGYTGLGTLSTTEADNFTTAAYQWKQFASPVTISGRDLLMNSGPSGIMSILEASIEAAALSLANLIGDSSTGVYSTQTESNLEALTGLQALVSATPTVGTVGNISRSAEAYWRNQTDSVTTNFSTDGLLSMDNLWTLCSFGSDTPDLVVGTRSFWVNLKRALTSTLSYNQPLTPVTAKSAVVDYGPNTIQYFGCPVMYDTNVPANSAYFLNSKYIHFAVHEARDFEIREFVVPSNADGIYSQVMLMAEQCFSGMRYHGLLTGSVDTYS